MFDFLTPLTPQDFSRKTEYLIENFLAKRMITLIYAPGGSGKSWLSMAIAKHAYEKQMRVIYLDFDNSLDSLESRNIATKLLEPCPSIHYELGGQSKFSAQEMLNNLDAVAYNNRFSNTLVIFDTLVEFCDVGNESQAHKGMRKFKKLRDAGATILLIHHTNKDGKNYQGANAIRNSIDSMFRLQKLDSEQGQVRQLLTVDKDRVRICDTAISTNVDDLSMMPIDLDTAKTTPEEKEFIQEVKLILSKQPGINKKELLQEMGYDKRNRTANSRLSQFETLYWRSEKSKGTYTYHLI